MKRIDWKQLWHSAKRSITHFPVELILAIFGSFVLIVEPFGDYSMLEVSTIFMLVLSIVWAYLLNQVPKNTR